MRSGDWELSVYFNSGFIRLARGRPSVQPPKFFSLKKKMFSKKDLIFIVRKINSASKGRESQSEISSANNELTYKAIRPEDSHGTCLLEK